MKKDFLNRLKGAILSKEEAKTISGGYDNGSYLPGGSCSFIICEGYPKNAVSQVSTSCKLPMPGKVYTTNVQGLYCVRYN